MKLKDRYFAPTPAKVKRILLIVKAALTAAAGSAYMEGSPKLAFWLTVSIGAINEICQFTHESDK